MLEALLIIFGDALKSISAAGGYLIYCIDIFQCKLLRVTLYQLEERALQVLSEGYLLGAHPLLAGYSLLNPHHLEDLAEHVGVLADRRVHEGACLRYYLALHRYVLRYQTPPELQLRALHIVECLLRLFGDHRCVQGGVVVAGFELVEKLLVPLDLPLEFEELLDELLFVVGVLHELLVLEGERVDAEGQVLEALLQVLVVDIDLLNVWEYLLEMLLVNP